MQKILDRYKQPSSPASPRPDVAQLQRTITELVRKNSDLEADLRVAVDEYSETIAENQKLKKHGNAQQVRAEKAEKELETLRASKQSADERVLVELMYADALSQKEGQALLDLQWDTRRTAEVADLRYRITREVVENILLPAAHYVENLSMERLAPPDRFANTKSKPESSSAPAVS
ncbi:hypothetical protein BU26DRAFT_568023 [Trematosphaeria pertusa]|uniref:Uncharacterized protein n=1 Tax=Trematosphaeria pertusa TaxID=390896 RepID=A0A6A6I535_9PLEO|nr:uncharacterized protein BU26DRAFT_568023 [Trematosphaeria pertusa]KAF2245437.1 hypothetical protein BU26DRAFT_568023 [Trematosphaeria pertusa]